MLSITEVTQPLLENVVGNIKIGNLGGIVHLYQMRWYLSQGLHSPLPLANITPPQPPS